MRSCVPTSLSAETLLSPSASESTATNDSPTFVNVSPLSRHARTELSRAANITTSITTELIPVLHRVPTTSMLPVTFQDGAARTTANAAPALVARSNGNGGGGASRRSSLEGDVVVIVGRAESLPSPASTVFALGYSSSSLPPSPPGTQASETENGENRSVDNQDELYPPPRCYQTERLLYTGIFIGFLFRSYYVGSRFFREHITEMRRGVGMPNPILASFLPTVGYDGGLDTQWIGFLSSLPSLFLLAAVLGGATRLLHAAADFASAGARWSNSFNTNHDADRNGGNEDLLSSNSPVNRPLHCTSVAVLRRLLAPLARRDCDVSRLVAVLYASVGFVFLAVVHGPHFIVLIFLIVANYAVFMRLQRWCPYWLFMTIMWSTHLTLLYAVELSQGFESIYWLQYVVPTDSDVSARVLGAAATPLWSTRLRWCVAFRMTVLRLIAFNYDLWEATHIAARARERATLRHNTACIECAQLREANSNNSSSPHSIPEEAVRCYKYRTECPRELADYDLLHYIAYLLFPPLYLAGPMSSFNAFVSYMRVPSRGMPPRAMLIYALRTLALFLVAYLHLHFWFIVALSERIDLLMEASPEFQSYILYYYLAYLWLKFAFIWKTSRLLAMMSGIEVPEDMRKCFSNTTTVRNFWRDWHASFNLWIVRYMYIPMGGRARVALTIGPIFVFIALWHDPALHLLKWALCIVVLFMLELAVSAAFGAVSRVFCAEMRKEMTAVGMNRGEVDNGSASSSVCQAVKKAVSALVRPAARWTYRHVLPAARVTCYRELLTIGCFFSVFGLIVANMVGFCVQNTSADVKAESSTDKLIMRALREARVPFYVGLFAILYSASGLGVSMWLWEDITNRQLRRRYRLRTS